jgi:hypothetical protein
MIRSKLTAITVAGVLSIGSMAVFAQSDAPVDKGGMPPSTEMNAGSVNGNALPPGSIKGGNGDDASGSSTRPGTGSGSMSGGSSIGNGSGSGSGESGSSGMSGSGGGSGSAGGGTGTAGGGTGGLGGE